MECGVKQAALDVEAKAKARPPFFPSCIILSIHRKTSRQRGSGSTSSSLPSLSSHAYKLVGSATVVSAPSRSQPSFICE